MEKNTRFNAVIEKSYKAQDPFELNLIKGEIITNVVETVNDGWFEGKLNGKVGMFHSSYARILNNNDENNTVIVFRDKAASANRRCKAVYSYTQNNDDELSLAVGDVIDFIEEVEEGWWRGRLKNKVGVFPSNFVEVMEPSPVLAIKRGHNTPAQTKKNLSNSKENLVSAGLTSDKDAPVLPPKPVRELCRVSYTYDPANEDELELVVGDVITVLSKDLPDKGWWKGELKGKIGVFPDNFVTIITEAPPIKDSSNHKPDRPPLSTKAALINKSPSGATTTTSSVRKDSFGSKDSLNETGIVAGNVAAHRLSLETRTITYDGVVTEKTNRKSIESKAGSDIRKSLENLDDKKSTPPPVLSKKPVVPIKKSPTISSVTGNLFSGFKQKVKGESKITTAAHDHLDGGGHSKPTSYIAEINEKGVIGDKIKKEDLDFDHVERGSVLQDMRAGRAKAPKRRLPSTAINAIGDRSSYMSNGNDESLTEMPSQVEEDMSKPKTREWGGKQKAPWMAELKANQMKKTSPSNVDAKSPENKQESSIDHESIKTSEMSKSFTSSYAPNKFTKSTTSELSSYEMRTSSVEVVKSSITETNTRNDIDNSMIKSMSAISNGLSSTLLDDSSKQSTIRPISTLLDETKTSSVRPISMNLRNRSISPTGRNSLTKSLTVTPPEVTKITNAVTTAVTTSTATIATTSNEPIAAPITNENVCNRVVDLELRLGKLEQLVQIQTTTIDQLVQTLRDEKDKVKFLKTELDKYAQCVTQV